MIEQRRFTVESGDVRPEGSWVYLWIDAATNEIAYIGATAFEPELRAHIHMTHPDPRLARVKNEVPGSEHRSFVVRAFRVPEGLDRAEIKSALHAILVEGERVPGGRPSELAEEISRLVKE